MKKFKFTLWLGIILSVLFVFFTVTFVKFPKMYVKFFPSCERDYEEVAEILLDKKSNVDHLKVLSCSHISRSKSFFKIGLSKNDFLLIKKELESKGYRKFVEINSMEGNFDIFNVEERTSRMLYSILIKDRKRYSIYYDEKKEVLTLIKFHTGW